MQNERHKSSLYAGVLNSFAVYVALVSVGLLSRTLYHSVEAKCTLGVDVCRFSGVLLIQAFKRRFRVVFWFVQYRI